MKKIIAFCSMLLALCAGATNITNYPVRTTFNANYWFLLSDVAAQTNWNLPGNYVASTTDLNSASNVLWQLYTNANVWTNNGRYVWLAGQKAPNPSDLTNGPPLFLTTNGDQYLAGDQHVMGNVYIGNSNAVLNIWTNFASWPLTFNVVGQGQFIATNTVFGPILDLHGSTNSEASFWIANHKTNGEVSISLRNDEGSASATSGRRSFISYLAVQDWGVPTYVTWETTMNAYGTHPWHIDWIPIDDGAHRNEYLTILTNGYVGIGATTPGYRLEVNGLAKADNIITPTNTPTDGYVLTATGTGGASKWAAASTNILTVYIDSAWITNLYVDNGWITNLYSDIAYITNLYTDSLTVTNLNVTNLFAGDIQTTNLYVENGWVTNLYAKYGWITNLYSDSAWITNLYANSGWITNLYTDKGYITNIFTQQVKYYTNQGTMAPDFSKGYDAISTNNNFTFLAPINTDANLKFVETTVKKVTNTSGTNILASLPANINAVPGSVWYITNVSWFTFVVYGSEQTNCYAVPIR